MDTPENGKKGRRRGLTSVTLGWIADRMRRSEKIKKEIEEGKYQVDSSKIAAAIVNDK